MPISRVAAGFLLIGAAIFLLLIAGLTGDPEVPIGIEWRVNIEMLIFIAALVLMEFGFYFMFSGKCCPVCDQKVGRKATDCRYCGYNFNTAPGPISHSPKIRAR